MWCAGFWTYWDLFCPLLILNIVVCGVLNLLGFILSSVILLLDLFCKQMGNLWRSSILPFLFYPLKVVSNSFSLAITDGYQTAGPYSQIQGVPEILFRCLNNRPNCDQAKWVGTRWYWFLDTVNRSLQLKGILWDLFIFTLEQIIVLNKYCT